MTPVMTMMKLGGTVQHHYSIQYTHETH